MSRNLVKPELLAPAGNMEKGKMALLYGADAIYLGGKLFGLRAFANNFSLEEIAEMAEYAHSLGKKVYVTVNIFAHNEDIDRLPDYLRGLQQAKVDALLISDLGVWSTARQVVPDMPLHVSTQANTTNYATVQAWEQLGADTRAVLGRNKRNQRKNLGRAGNLRAWRNVHFLQRTLPFERLSDRARRQPRCLHSGLPLGI
mgnify:CR=1 FL=1